MSLPAIDMPGGKLGASSGENQFASTISTSSSVTSPDSYHAPKPIISWCGNGHGWLPRYSTFPTVMPTSSRISRRTACSSVSPGSTNPARVENIPAGKFLLRASSALPSLRSSNMITAGARRG